VFRGWDTMYSLYSVNHYSIAFYNIKYKS